MAHKKETEKGSRHRRTPSGQRWMAQRQGVIHVLSPRGFASVWASRSHGIPDNPIVGFCLKNRPCDTTVMSREIPLPMKIEFSRQLIIRQMASKTNGETPDAWRSQTIAATSTQRWENGSRSPRWGGQGVTYLWCSLTSSGCQLPTIFSLEPLGVSEGLIPFAYLQEQPVYTGVGMSCVVTDTNGPSTNCRRRPRRRAAHHTPGGTCLCLRTASYRCAAEACGDGSMLKAAYRFFDNDGIAPQDILQSHVESTYTRLGAVPWSWLCRIRRKSTGRGTRPPKVGALAIRPAMGFCPYDVSHHAERVPLGLLPNRSGRVIPTTWASAPAQAPAHEPERKSEMAAQS